MVKWVMAVLVVGAMGAGPATRPATHPAQWRAPRLKASAPQTVRDLWEAQRGLRAENKRKLLNVQKQLKEELYRRRHRGSAKAQIDETINDLKLAEQAYADMDNRWCYPELSELRIGTIWCLSELRIIQVIDDGNAIAEIAGETVWLKYPTGTMVDNHAYELKETVPYWISGTKSYGAVSGTNRTVMLAEPFRFEDFLE